jgi:hypothetical protein
MEKEANKTPVLILLPTVFCIFPPMLILLLAPAVVRFQAMMPDISAAFHKPAPVERRVEGVREALVLPSKVTAPMPTETPVPSNAETPAVETAEGDTEAAPQ